MCIGIKVCSSFGTYFVQFLHVMSLEPTSYHNSTMILHRLGWRSSKNMLIKKWKIRINNQKNKKELYNKIILPPIITSEKNFDIISYPLSKPNFVTKKKIKSEIIEIKKIIDTKNISEKVTLVLFDEILQCRFCNFCKFYLL